MKAFRWRAVRKAIEHAAAGGQALHLHRSIPNRGRAPQVFLREVAAGRPIAHLFDQDRDRLVKTAKRLGVKVIKVERDGTDRQHIDLCGGPLAKALAGADNPAEVEVIRTEMYLAFVAEKANPNPVRSAAGPGTATS